MSVKTCSICLHWVDGFCRSGPPTGSTQEGGVWPKTAATDWCHRFRPAVISAGHDRKFTDEQVLDEVRVYDQPEHEEGGVTLPRCAVKRKDLIDGLIIQYGVTYTPALRRVEKLVRRGLLKMGENPWPTEKSSPGIYVWLGEGAPESPPEKKASPKHLIELIRELAPDERRGLSVRKLTKAVESTLGLSSTSVHRKLKGLVMEKLVVDGPWGYYAAPFENKKTEL